MAWRDERSKTAPVAMMRAELSIRPVLHLTAGRAMALVVTFATPLVLARIFDQAEFGTYKQLFLVYSTFVAIAQLGMVESLLYFVPSGQGRGGQYILNAVLVLSGSGLLCLGLFALTGSYLSHWFGNPALSTFSLLLGGYLLLTLPSTVLEIVMTARKRYTGAGATYALSDLFRAIALVAPAVVSGRLEWLLAGAVVYGAIRLGMTLLYLGREFGAELRPDGATLRKQLAYALPFQLGGALWILVLNLHYYLVAPFVSAATFAIYAVGCLPIPVVDLVWTPAKNVMMVRMREAITARRPDAALAIWHDTTRKLALVFFPLVGLLLAMAPGLIPFLFTERYTASVPVFMAWSTGALIIPVQADGVLGVYADTRAMAALYAVHLLVVAGLVPALMSTFGLVGAAAACALAMGIGKGLLLARAKHLMGVTLTDLLPWRSLGEVLGAAAVSATAALAVKAHLAIAPLPLLAVTAGVYAVTFLGILAMGGRLGIETGQVTTKRIRVLLGWPAKAR